MMNGEDVTSCQESNSTLLLGLGDATKFTSSAIKEALEKDSVDGKAEALKHLIRLQVNGEPQNAMIMTVIKYAVPVNDHLIKKLVLYFWEVVDKRDQNGDLLNVIILICSFLRNDLEHANEYVRGLTLRFLCKIDERELVGPLTSAVVQNLTHSVAYVRRNAVLAVQSIYKRFPDLLIDAPDLMESFIRNETDATARRNAFDMLATFTPERASKFLMEFKESHNLADAASCFLMSVVDFCGQMIRENPYERAKYVSILFSVLHHQALAVRFQCATTLLNLSASPTAIQQAAQTYIDILKSCSDNSVRLIVVQRLELMRNYSSQGLQDSLMDLLNALQDSLLPVRKRIIKLAVGVITSKNIDIFIQAMKNELISARNDSDGPMTTKDPEYTQLLIKSIGTALLECPKVISSVLPVLLDFLSDSTPAADEVVTLIKRMLQVYPKMRVSTVEKLVETFPLIILPSVMRSLLLLLSNYVESQSEIVKVVNLIMTEMGPLPLSPPKIRSLTPGNGANTSDNKNVTNVSPKLQAITTVREDGTYMTTYTTAPANVGRGGSSGEITDEQDGLTRLRNAILQGNGSLVSTLASVLPKLITKLFTYLPQEADRIREMQSNAARLLKEVLRYGTDEATTSPLENDCQEHLYLSLLLLDNPQINFLVEMVQASKEGLPSFYQELEKDNFGIQGQYGRSDSINPRADSSQYSIDAPLIFTQLAEESSSENALCDVGAPNDIMSLQCGNEAVLDGGNNSEQLSSKSFLQRVQETVALSGFCDPIYCEATVEVHQIDIIVNWLLVNRCDQVLSNVTIELTSLGGMRLVERPQSYTLPPRGKLQVRTALKVGAAESGILYGKIFFDGPQRQNGCVMLNDIHINIMNYIKPAYCKLSEFRYKWGIFDWENKVDIVTSKRQIRDYIEFIAKELNMQMLDDNFDDYGGEQDGVSSFANDWVSYEYASCNLYAKTIFDEDALVNVSLEDEGNGVISGVVRVRSNVKSVAYGIGEKLSTLQKNSG